jgi:hypothetical protein
MLLFTTSRYGRSPEFRLSFSLLLKPHSGNARRKTDKCLPHLSYGYYFLIDPKDLEELKMDEETVVTKMDAETIEILLDDRVATGG